MRILRYLHAFVALLLLRGNAVHMAVLGAAHMERHLNGARKTLITVTVASTFRYIYVGDVKLIK